MRLVWVPPSHQRNSFPGHPPAAAALPVGETENPGNVPPHQPPCNRNRTRGGKRSAISQVKPGLPAHSLSPCTTRPVHNLHALDRPTTAVLNWTISRSMRKTAESKQAACCKQTRGTVTFHPGDTAVPEGTSLQRGGDGEGEKSVLVCGQAALFALGNVD